jgi:5-oxoprolinase (ATP-hydrolysing) subunit A
VPTDAVRTQRPPAPAADVRQAVFQVDLNCDMGESFGAYRIGADAKILPFVSSANIACGFHGGDPAVMRKTVAAAVMHGVAIGAHPGFQDLAGFGRRNMDVTAQEAYDLVVYQVGALLGFATAEGARLQHVKAHGALYNMAAAQAPLAEAIARAVHDVDSTLVLFALAGSHMVTAGRSLGLRTASEVFADRNYMPDGSLVSRKRPDAMVDDVDEAARRAVRMVKEGRVRSVEGTDVTLRAETICIHGDGTHAVEFAWRLRTSLESEGVIVRSLGRGVPKE